MPRTGGAFTLIEMVISISVGVIISGIAGFILLNASSQRAEITARGELYDMGSTAMEVMFRHVREIAQDECPAGATPCLLGHAQISAAASSDLRFASKGFRSNSTDRTIEMSLDAGATWNRLATDVASLTFSYYGRTASQLIASPLSAMDRAAVRRIVVDLQLARSGQTAHLRSAVYLRNFMNEVGSVP